MEASPLHPVLQDIASYLDELKQTLVAEYEAIAHDDIGKLTSLAETKLRLSEILDDLEQEKLRQLKTAGLDLSKTGLDDYLCRQENSQNPLQGLWQRIRTLSHDCQRLNQINGIIIEKQRRRTETTLAILYGRPAESDLYTATGSQQTAATSHTLTKA